MFSYLTSETPTITEMTYEGDDIEEIVAGTTVTVQGNLDGTDLKDEIGSLTATIGGVDVDLTANDATGFDFDMPALSYGIYTLSLVHATKGNAKNDI